jgi:hypothetical protein
MTRLWIGILISIFFLVVWTGCGRSADNSNSSSETATEVAASSIGGAVSSTETSGTVSMRTVPEPKTLKEKVLSLINPGLDMAYALTSCPVAIGQACTGASSNIVSLTYSACQFLVGGGTWSGTHVLTFGAGATCSTFVSGSMPSSGTLTRNLNAVRTSPLTSVAVTIDSNSATGWSSSVSGGTTITFGSGTRSITINGVNLAAASNGTTRWNHTVSTTAPIVVSGVGNTKTVTSGTVLVQHNIARYNATAAVSQTLIWTNSCCHPTSGKITSTLTGSVTGTETLEYGPSCGSATITNRDGQQSSINLRHCF